MQKKTKLISWNINGLKSSVSKGLIEFINQSGADIICLQETKSKPETVKADWPSNYNVLWNPAQKAGYSGTATFTRLTVLSLSTSIGIKEGDLEGRVQILEFEHFYLVNVYTPNSKRELLRLNFRCNKWDKGFLKHIKKLEKTKPVVICGDLNVSHQEIDLANPGINRRNAGFTDEERAGFEAYVRAGFIDTFRVFEKGSGQYTWWAYRNKARERNIGWRLDYFLVSKGLKNHLISASILKDVTGSDHCPVTLELDI